MSHVENAKVYNRALLAELIQVQSAAPADIVDLVGITTEISAHLLRVIRASDPDPSALLMILRHLLAMYSETSDAELNRELRRRRYVAYRWCCRAMEAWFCAAMREKAKMSYARGSWSYWVERADDWAALLRCFARLELAGLALRYGMSSVDIADAADKLLTASATCAS